MRGFFEIAETCPDRLAVVDMLPDGRSTRYGELRGLVDRISNGLVRLGVEPGDPVVVVLPNGLDFVAFQLATLQIGAYLVPVNWHFTAEEIAYILGDCGARVVVTAAPYGRAVHRAAERAGTEHRFATAAGVLGFRDLDELLGDDTPPADRRMGSMMLYTSGTTGRPKGVRRRIIDITPEELHTILMRKTYRHFGLVPGDEVHLVASQLYHSAPYAHALMSLNLGHAVIAPERFEPVAALELIERFGVTNTFMVPTMFHRLLALPAEERERHALSTLTRVFHSAAPCPPAIKESMMRWLGEILYEYYGSTEAAVATFVGPREWRERPGTVGRAVEGMEIRILSEDGQELPPGESGLVYVRGVARFEYHRDPGKTRSAMRDRLYTPGDIGYLDEDGYLFLRDRRTDLIISGGVNIYPAEIEAALMEHPSVADVAVIGVPDPEWGHRVVALVQPSPGARPGDALTRALLEHCETRLARLKHPRQFEYRATLPRTATGKLSRSRLRAEFTGGGPSRHP
ncbi:acyl-CoA synthetase [Bailinhaonella thermotolerans]|uniref:Acyl-CoA synthetase n=1 Tax=Bailinhaonella thermotolerans TaxID=1070861 RepID=A0A3A4AL81_9ACTN|nr:acyl-CoA synthetase [Bailinhaonella thermotolerans]